MKKKIIVFLFLLSLLFMSYYYKGSEKRQSNATIVTQNIKSENKVTKVNIIYNEEKASLNLEDYVVGVVACEMPASFNIEALKALSVAARTYVLYKITKNSNYVLKTTTSDQCYIDEEKMRSKWGNSFTKYYNKIVEAVVSTRNEVMTYNDEVIISFYFAISNGYTENSEDVFSQKLDYLVSVNSNWDSIYNYKEENIIFTHQEFERLVGIKDINNNEVELDRNKSNRVNKIIIRDKEFSGTEFRKLLGLKSTDFTINISDSVVIHTKGYGHGVGMSEYGANAMASEGYKYEDILKHYYSGIKIVNNY